VPLLALSGVLSHVDEWVEAHMGGTVEPFLLSCVGGLTVVG
jgi:hypothetical protein